MLPKVSFVLTVYNKEAWIAQTLRTIISQTMKDIEIIVWDDGSTDNSMAVAKEVLRNQPNVKFGGTAENQGIAKAYNQAHRMVTAPVVCIASADDLYDRLRAQRSYDYFQKHPKVKIIYSHFIKVTARGALIEDKRVPTYNKEKLFLPNNQYIPHGFMAVRKEVIDTVQYDETIKYGVDYPWIKELANTYDQECFARVNCYFGQYRWLETNVSHQHREEIVLQGNA